MNKRNIIISTIAILCLAAPVAASELAMTDADFEKFAVPSATDPSQVTIDIDYLDSKLEILWSKAKSYPPKFVDAGEYQDALKLTAFLMEIVKIAGPQFEEGSPIRAAHIYNIGYNLDMPEASDREPIAIRYYRKAIEQFPDNPLPRLDLGAFLLSANAPEPLRKEAIQHLKKAVEFGLEDARFTLGMAYFIDGDQPKAEAELTAYLKVFPDDTRTQELLKQMKAGKITTETH